MRRWGVDDWFRPRRWDGRLLGSHPALTRRDRTTAWCLLAFCLLVPAGVVLLLRPGQFGWVGGFLGVGFVQVVVLVRTRRLSRFARRRRGSLAPAPGAAADSGP